MCRRQEEGRITVSRVSAFMCKGKQLEMDLTSYKSDGLCMLRTSDSVLEELQKEL